MKLNKKEMLNALDKVKPGISTQENVEQATSVAFSDGKLYSFNDEISVQMEVPGLDIEGAVRAREFTSILRKLKPDKNGNLKGRIDGNELYLRGQGKSETGLNLEAEIRMPLSELGDLESEYWIDLPSNFLKGARFALFSAAKSSSDDPILACIHVNGQFIESSDNFRLTQYNMGKKAKKSFPEPLLIPASSIKQVLQYDPIKYTRTEGWIHFKNEDGIIISCRIFADDNYPSADKYIYELESPNISLPDTIEQSLDGAQVFTEDSEQDLVFLYIDNSKVIIKGEGEAGWFKDELKSKNEDLDEPIQFAANPHLLRDILKDTRDFQIDEDRLIKFEKEGEWTHLVALESTEE